MIVTKLDNYRHSAKFSLYTTCGDAHLDLSVMLACMALSLAGGMYAPPVRVVRANTSSSFVFFGALSFLSPSPVSPPASLQIRITSKIHVTGSSLIISVTVFLKSFLSGIHRFTFSKFFFFKEKFTTRSTFIFCALLSIFITPFPIINYHSQIIFHKTNSLSGYKQILNRNTNFTSTENGNLHRNAYLSICLLSLCLRLSWAGDLRRSSLSLSNDFLLLSSLRLSGDRLPSRLSSL